ncbi:CHASE domain-containing protein [Magnetospirillum gryphiswaldense]|uniref:histidine kinase n=1 Tax=Magnetospirillum gryphiswaldense TaxID=55518 RepID=A4U070_9PROT|nr:CHASE domain-containing protein [Magnetospirillum gryphiswaldense]AVM75290.1 Phytochrome-like protein cph1 [Magnetospirillum gryphiswaldense MSR-1]AVM79193.1 Phytochrome-like protein cph1 [Magnetospirillum gryphiswaldense]CAM76277.1 Signal transduction histidine kinase [Magnetospirillum gryphiswaldense MSR-1]
MNPSLLLRSLRAGQVLFLALLLAMTLAASLFIWWAEVQREEANARSDFERNTDQMFSALSARLEIFQAILRAGAGTWAEYPDMGVNEWNTFVQRALLDADYPGVDGLAVAVPIDARQQQAFVTDIRQRLWRNFAIYPDNTGRSGAVITHISPLSRAAKAIGFDISSHPGRWQAAQLARDTGKTTLSTPLSLITSGGENRSFLLIHPIYRPDYPIATVTQRRDALFGWLLLGLHAQTLVGNIANTVKDPLLDISVYSGSITESNRIYGADRPRRLEAGMFETRRVLDFAGSRWTLLAHRHLPRSALWFGAAPLILLGICIALSLAVTAATTLLLVSREQSRQLALQAMGQLSRTERTLAGVTASAPGTVFQWQRRADGSGGFTFVSPQAIPMFGIAPESLTADWRHLPFAPEELQAWPQAMAAAADSQDEWQMEGRYRAVDGGLRWWKCTASSSPGDDGSVALNGIFVDITEQKDAQRQLAERERTYREMFERTSAVKVLIDPENGEVIDANAAACSYYGYGADDTKRWASQVSLMAEDALRDVLARSAGGEQQFFRSRHRLLSGDVREVEVHMGPVRMNGRQYVHAIVHDVTDREHYQAELVEKSAKLETSNAELEQFSYVASHDLQEPLRTIASFLQLLERRYDDRLDDDGRQFIGFAVDAASRLQAMIQDLLEYSRVGTRGRPFAATDMDRVCSVAQGNLTRATQESGASIIAEPLPKVMADEVQMVSLLQNLMGNGLKYRRENVAPQIRIWAEEEAERWVFSVADNGIGIEPQYFDRIFLVFQRLHTREKFGGTGIGLALCRKIVQRHGGDIWLDSVPGQGTTFHFSLPKRSLSEAA